MNKLLCLLTLSLLFSCSKTDTPAPTPQPPPLPPPPPLIVDSVEMKTGWSKLQVANTLLSDVTWIDANRLAITAPYYRKIYSSADGGINWSPLPHYAYGVNLTSRPSGRLYWTVGDASITWIYRDRNGVPDSANLNKVAADMVFLDDSTGYASLTSAPGLAQTHNGGDTWELAATGPINFGSSFYSTLFFLDSNHGLVSFDRRVYYTNQGISNWQQSTISAPSTFNVYCSKVQMVSPNLAYAGFSDGSLFRSIDSGKSFTPVQLPLTKSTSGQEWLDFQFLDSNNGYLCFVNLILQTNNGGNNWDTVVYDKKRKIIELEFLDTHHGAAVTDSGKVFLFKN